MTTMTLIRGALTQWREYLALCKPRIVSLIVFTAIAGMFVGFGITLFYLLVTRYFPVEGVTWFGMWANSNAVTGLPVVDVQAALALPYEEAYAMLHSKVGWFGLNNISAAIFGLPAGFLVMWLVSRVTPAPSRELQDFIDEVRRPRGDTIMQDKAT